MLKWAVASLGSVVMISVLSFGLVVHNLASTKPAQDILGAYNQTRYQLSSSVSGKLTNEVYDLIDKATKPIEIDIPIRQLTDDSAKEELQKDVILLQQRLAAQERAMAEMLLSSRGSASTTSTSKPANTFIPLGIGGSSASTDWTVINTQEIEVDPAEFPGYLGAYFIVELRVKDGNGKGHVRLFNVTDNVPIYSSETSVTSGEFTPVSSGSFTFATGKKKYRLQLKSLTGYQVDVQLSKIKIAY